MLLVITTVSLLISSPAVSEQTDPSAAVQEIAALHADLNQFQVFGRISEEVMFRQSLAILARQYGWKEQYGGKEVEWTLALRNALNQTMTEANQARQAIARSRVLSDSEKEAGDFLFDEFEGLVTTGNEIDRLLAQGEVSSAAALFEESSIVHRNAIVRETVSSTIQIGARVKDIGLDVLLGR